MPEQAKCRSCGAAILWCRTAKGKRMPLDAEPTPDGRWKIDDGMCHQELSGLFGSGVLHKSHWETCPQAKEWKAK